MDLSKFINPRTQAGVTLELGVQAGEMNRSWMRSPNLAAEMPKLYISHQARQKPAAPIAATVQSA
jgi:hypothetical protein